MILFQVRTRVVFGDNILESLGSEVRGLGISRLFVVTDRFIGSAGIVDRLDRVLREAGLESVIFDGVDNEPVLNNISAAEEAYSQSGCRAVLGLGGGSCIDTAKAVSILASNPGPLESFGDNKEVFPPHPVIAVPTTAGAGSEVTGQCVFTERDRKILIRSPYIQPVLAVLDPCLLATIPPRVAAATGIDTLAHGIEAYLSTGGNPITDALALDSIRLVTGSLPAFVANGRNIVSAGNMQMACVMAALAAQWAGEGAVQAMAHVLGGRYRIPHGLASAVLLPCVMKFNLIANPEKYTKIAAAAGARVEGLSSLNAAYRSVSMVKELNRVLGIPAGLRELGVTEDSLEPMSLEVTGSDLLGPNSRVATVEDIARIFREAMD